MDGTWQEWVALAIVAGAVGFLWRRFRGRPEDALVQPRGRLARALEEVRKEDEKKAKN
ncbi:MAG: hypothetical protein AAF658_09590 [Myxococcota bacterium]